MMTMAFTVVIVTTVFLLLFLMELIVRVLQALAGAVITIVSLAECLVAVTPVAPKTAVRMGSHRAGH